ncbi:MAG: sucrase ferredoxin [Chloroflexota bacterium]|nr:sucrase ferredoxin [Chloroflexota bacterium]
MTPNPNAPFYCSECSRAAGEQLFGTAPRADVWIMLEYNGSWGAKAPDDSDLSPQIKTCITHWLAAIPHTKFTFIRQRDDARAPHPIRLYIARVLEMTPELYRLDLNSYDELLTVDMAGLALGAAEVAEHLTDETLFLVCVNGRRDVSCAKYGVPVLEAFRHQSGSSVWGTTHIGGHRFAATLVTLPDGVVYGYVDPADASSLIADSRAGQVRLDKLRGRSCYSDAAQAADHYVRQARTITDLPGLRLIGVETIDAGTWRVRFEMLGSGLTTTVTVAHEMSTFDVYKDSAGTGEPVSQFRLVSIV